MDQWFLERLEHQEHQGWEINVAAWCNMYVHVLSRIKQGPSLFDVLFCVTYSNRSKIYKFQIIVEIDHYAFFVAWHVTEIKEWDGSIINKLFVHS